MDENRLFEAYCDASGIFAERFQSIGTVSGHIESLQSLRKELITILRTNNVKEIKFVMIKRQDSREERTARQFIFDTTQQYIASGLVRVDVLIWDTTDSRHSIPGRDDIENLGRLYYHLLCSVFQRWVRGYWNVIIDKDERVDFNTLRDCINNVMTRPPDEPSLGLVIPTQQTNVSTAVKDIGEAESSEEPLLQLADIFAGMARFSREKGTECCSWLASCGNPDQLPLLGLLPQPSADDSARSDQCRFKLIGDFYKVCKKHRLGVNLNEKKYLWTPSPTFPMNFWPWDPQGEYDKAPVKQR
jgi:hypothetical protein